jgi:hypothetical protein
MPHVPGLQDKKAAADKAVLLYRPCLEWPCSLTVESHRADGLDQIQPRPYPALTRSRLGQIRFGVTNFVRLRAHSRQSQAETKRRSIYERFIIFIRSILAAAVAKFRLWNRENPGLVLPGGSP